MSYKIIRVTNHSEVKQILEELVNIVSDQRIENMDLILGYGLDTGLTCVIKNECKDAFKPLLNKAVDDFPCSIKGEITI